MSPPSSVSVPLMNVVVAVPPGASNAIQAGPSASAIQAFSLSASSGIWP